MDVLRCLKIAALLVALNLAAPLGGCVAPRGPRVVSDPDPTVKIPAIKFAAQSGNTRSVPLLVKDLENDDPAVRLYAIRALRHLTGEDFGYVYYQSDEQRHPAILKWQSWLRDRSNAPASKTSAP